MNRLNASLLLLLLASCSKHEASSYKEISLSFDGTLEWSSESTTTSDGTSDHETFIDGLAYSLDLDEGTLHVGDESFTGLVPGDKVLIGSDGILVNGEHRWDLPAQDEN